MCPWAFGGCDRSRRWGRRWCGRGLFCVLWSSCALYSPLAPLVSSKSPPPSRWAVGQRLSERYPPVFFLVEKKLVRDKAGQKFYLPTCRVCCHPTKKVLLLVFAVLHLCLHAQPLSRDPFPWLYENPPSTFCRTVALNSTTTTGAAFWRAMRAPRSFRAKDAGKTRRRKMPPP